MYPTFQPNPPNQGTYINANNNPNKPQQGLNSFQQPQFANQGFIGSQGASSANNRGVYASTIHASTSSSNLSKGGGFGLSRLEAMGRTIKDDNDAIESKHHETPFGFSSNQNNNLAFKPNNDKGKLASSVIFQKNYDQDINRFPGFNVGQAGSPQVGTSRLDALFAKKQPAQIPKEEVPEESAQDKRKREINAIKQELEFLNKRMENTVVKKDGESKPYFQLPTRKTSTANNAPVEAPKTTTTETTQDPTGSKSFFQNYAKGNQSTTNTQSSGISQFLTETKPIQPVQPVQPTQIPISNPAKPESGGGMFKKKNPYLLEQPVKITDYTPKTFMLSPKGAPLNLGFKSDQIIAKPEVKPEFKAAEVISISPPKKGMRKTGSSQKLIEQGPKKFTKADFAIGKKMGKGQFGEVMLCQHKETGFLCGMKVMSKKQIREEKYVNQIARELSIQFFLNHRNIAPLYGYFEDEENVYLLIEYCTGGQLLQLLRKHHRMEEPDTSPIIREICEGLDYIHKEQIIHRDIKPENILFNFNTVKICDFGWAVHCGSGMRKTVSGSPLYYSPEIVQETEYDEKVDIWAVGMMTYECLLGKIPFKIYSELDLNRIVEDEVKFPEYVDVTDESKSFILGIMQKNPDDRMVMKDIFKHPFIRKYAAERKVSSDILEEFRRVLN